MLFIQLLNCKWYIIWSVSREKNRGKKGRFWYVQLTIVTKNILKDPSVKKAGHLRCETAWKLMTEAWHFKCFDSNLRMNFRMLFDQNYRLYSLMYAGRKYLPDKKWLSNFAQNGIKQRSYDMAKNFKKGVEEALKSFQQIRHFCLSLTPSDLCRVCYHTLHH